MYKITDLDNGKKHIVNDPFTGSTNVMPVATIDLKIKYLQNKIADFEAKKLVLAPMEALVSDWNDAKHSELAAAEEAARLAEIQALIDNL